MLRDTLRTPKLDYLQRFRFPAGLPARSATAQWLLLFGLVGSGCSQNIPSLYILGSISGDLPVVNHRFCHLALFEAVPLRDCHEPARFQVADLWLLVTWKWHRPVGLFPKKLCRDYSGQHRCSGDSKRMGKQRFAIAPVRCLDPGRQLKHQLQLRQHAQSHPLKTP